MQMPQDEALAATLGQRLDALGRQVAARHLITFAWAGGVAPVLGHVARLSELFGGRFERDETSGATPLVTGRPTGRAGRGPATDGARLTPGVRAEPDQADRPLPADVRARLRDAAGPGAEVMRVHAGSAADRRARTLGADAVTEGADVYLRGRQLSPDEPADFALLAHEAAHVTALLDPGLAARRAAASGPAAEEELALGVERAAGLRPAPAPGRWRPPVPAQPPPAPVPRPAAAAAASPAPAGHAAPAAARPMRAAQDRELAQAAPFDVDELRRGLITDLMHQLRTEFERGG